jgi:hypothetical protein
LGVCETRQSGKKSFIPFFAGWISFNNKPDDEKHENRSRQKIGTICSLLVIHSAFAQFFQNTKKIIPHMLIYIIEKKY